MVTASPTASAQAKVASVAISVSPPRSSSAAKPATVATVKPVSTSSTAISAPADTDDDASTAVDASADSADGTDIEPGRPAATAGVAIAKLLPGTTKPTIATAKPPTQVEPAPATGAAAAKSPAQTNAQATDNTPDDPPAAAPTAGKPDASNAIAAPAHPRDTASSAAAATHGGNAGQLSTLPLANLQSVTPPALTAASAQLVPQAATVVPVPVPLTALALEIGARAHTGDNRFDIRLDPPELGRIDVHLHVDAHGQVTSHIVVDRADTLNLLQRDASDLQQSLQQAGLKTGDGGLQFSLRDQSFAGNGGGAGQPTTAPIIIPDIEPIGSEIMARTYTRAGQGSGVDIRV